MKPKQEQQNAFCITTKTLCDSRQSVPGIEVTTCRRHSRAQVRTVLAASSLAMLVAEPSWVAGVLAVSFARFWGELVAVARPRWEAPGHVYCTRKSVPILKAQCKSAKTNRHSVLCITWCICKLHSTLGA